LRWTAILEQIAKGGFLASVADPERATTSQRTQDVAVLIPCFNEALTVASVVGDFRIALPNATIYVFDNNSTDATAARAREAGATVVRSARQGKGEVVRHMFDLVEADIYVMADGDGTYDARSASALVAEIESGRADMAIGTRLSEFDPSASFRRFHHFGNHLISRTISLLFGVRVIDVLSGFRAFSRDFAKGVPLAARGFEIETELTMQAVHKGFALVEIETSYGTRPAGSESKLDTFGDGLLILQSILMIAKDYRPLTFFGLLSALALAASLAAGIPPILDYLRAGYVYHVPLAILASGLALLAALILSAGMILHTMARLHQENFRLWHRLHRRVDRAFQETRRS
jgi:glycosyltransferase involved in cell wall biosynthesis